MKQLFRKVTGTSCRASSAHRCRNLVKFEEGLLAIVQASLTDTDSFAVMQRRGARLETEARKARLR